MSKLINELLEEHKKLFSLLDELRNIGKEGAKEKLFESKKRKSCNSIQCMKSALNKEIVLKLAKAGLF
jgi:hypothetical protein